MAIPASGTFDYVFHVPAGPQSGSRKLKGGLRDPLGRRDRLLGHAPTLEAIEYKREEWQLYSRVTLTASRWRLSGSRSMSFSVDRALIRTLRAGDVLNISRTGCGGLGLSILRDGDLVAAAGAITKVPLGAGLTARNPGDLVEQAEMVFRARDPQYRMGEYPIELSVEGETRIVHRGRPRLGPYDIFVIHGFIIGIPGTDERVSIERTGVCPDTAAHTTVQLFETERMEIS